ncbi:hypothetical protein DYB37_000485 [Aphanomyces astaci]|uniref:Kinesin motor domain-containing protein n=1 Tax=Aphanomyces astaci TaxID=112090 RepID=A0A418FIN0_APHAT|nr:hypothetical protein DYB37_000485 [Aphanomyces astaci]
MDAQRALLDELMGRNRDGDKPEEDISDFRDSRVCKRFLCGLCPHDLFQNTKMDMGECEKLHLPKLKVAYDAEKSKPHSRDYGYENDLLRELERYVSDVEKKIARAQKRLEEQEGARPPTLADIESSKEVLEITAEIADLMQKAEDAGNEGEVDLSMELMAQVEVLKLKKNALQANPSSSDSSGGASAPTPVVNEYDATQLHLMNVLPGNPLAMTNVNNKLRVCDMCGAFLSIFDSDRRLADHFGGKMHLGYMQIRKKIAEMKLAREAAYSGGPSAGTPSVDAAAASAATNPIDGPALSPIAGLARRPEIAGAVAGLARRPETVGAVAGRAEAAVEVETANNANVVAGATSTMTADDCVQVCVRIRPTSKKEKVEAAIAANNCVRVPASPIPTQLVVGKDRPFTFDRIHTVDTTQEALYAASVTSLVEGFGYNATVLAYGQTGTGKTFTMTGGAAYSTKIQDAHGVIPRAVCHVFALMQARHEATECLLRVEYLEIYNEELRDLLHPETSSKVQTTRCNGHCNLSIREDADGHIVVTGAKSQAVQSPDDVMRLLSMGSAARVTGSTQMNEQSSRSHAIFTLVLQQKARDSGELTHAKFHLVDLAGSERAKRTGAVGGRFKVAESVNINQGLLALGNVISALGDDAKKKNSHVPYRDSKLTRLLQDSLGGNSKTLMIACVSPVAANFDETLNTLKYANRAKNIKNRPVVNHVKEADTDDTILRMKQEIELLQRQLGTPPTPVVAVPVDNQQSHHEQLEAEWTSAKVAAKQGATALVALERDIKSLGRPIQQRLNDVVKVLNGIVVLQHDNSSSSELGLIIDASDTVPTNNNQPPHRHSREFHAEINALHEKLKQDVEIFELKSQEMDQFQRQLASAHVEIESLRALNQQLQRDAAAKVPAAGMGSPTRPSGEAGPERKSQSLFARRHHGVHDDDDGDNVLMAEPEVSAEIPVARAQTAKLPRSAPPPLHSVAALPPPPKTADPSAAPLDKTAIRAMFQTQLLAAVESHVKQAQVATMLHAKEATAKEKDEIARRKHGLEMEKMRQSLSVQSSITDLSETIHAMNCKLNMAAAPDPDELARLKRRKERAEKKLALFVQKMETQSYVDPAVQDELTALEEQIEDLTSQILFQDSQLESAQALMVPSKASNIDHLLKHVASSGATIDRTLKTWITMCWTEMTLQLQDEMVAQLTQNREQLENGLHAARAEYDRRLMQNELLQTNDKKQMDELMVLLADKQCQIDVLNAAEKTSSSDAKTLADLNHLVTARQNELDQLKKRLVEADKDKKRFVEYDRYVSERQVEWESKHAQLQQALEGERHNAQVTIDALMQQVAAAQTLAASTPTGSEELMGLKDKLQTQQEYVVSLEKHVVLFKNKAKQAQQQLQQLIRDSSGNQSSDDDNPRIKQLEDVNDCLMKENAAMKVHMRAMKGAEPSEPHVRVRIPKAELKEIDGPTDAVARPREQE